MSWISKAWNKVWTGYAEDDLRYNEMKLIKKWGSIDPKKVQITDISVSSTAEDTIHCISINPQVMGA